MIILSERERERVALPFNSAILLGSVWGGLFIFYMQFSSATGQDQELKTSTGSKHGWAYVSKASFLQGNMVSVTKPNPG